MTSGRLPQALERFDRANAQDPRQELVDGQPIAREFVYGRRMSACLDDWLPAAPEALQLAVRSQHLCRWRLSRTSFAAGRKGYLAWRRECARMHAELAAETMTALGYDEAMIERVQDLLQKKNLKSDAEAQTLEDVACLVFLRFYADAFVGDHSAEQNHRVFSRTWRKMSGSAHERALELQLPTRVGELLEAVLQSPARLSCAGKMEETLP